MDEFYDYSTLEHRLIMIKLLGKLIKTKEGIVDEPILNDFLFRRFLSDEIPKVRLACLDLLIAEKDFIGIKIFESSLIDGFSLYANKQERKYRQMFCLFVKVV